MIDTEFEALARTNLGEALYAKLQKAVDYTDGTHRMGDVIRGIASGRYQMMMSDRSVVITEIIDYPTGARACHVFLSAGSLSDHVQVMMPRLEAFARSIGADRITAVGRHGWGRAGKVMGFEPTRTLICKKLSKGDAP